MKLSISLLRQIPKLFPMCRKYSSHGKEIDLKGIVGKKIAEQQKRIAEFRAKHGKTVVGEINVNMLYGGMRGLLGLIYETSLLDPESGITFRGYDIPTLKKQLPTAKDGCEPLPEGIFWLLLTGKIPTKDEVEWVSKEWVCRSELPPYVSKILGAMPNTMHPMVQLSCAIASMNNDGKFQAAYNKEVKKAVYWEYVYEDAMDLIARIIKIAAIIYKNTYKNREPVGKFDECADWSKNFASMMGYNDAECIEMFRLYLTIHCDHEGGNVSAHTAHIVGSALSDCYLSYSAALNGLAGPLHGLANQMVLVWLMKMQKNLGNDLSDEKIKKYVEDTMKSGSVVPGYGHAVLRKTDPRYVAQHEFAQAHFPDFPLNQLVAKLYKIVPEVLKGVKKVRNPWPNVDAHSGVLLQYYGIKEMNFYTVMFGVSRAIGVLAMMVWSRALGFAIERPKSITTNHLEKMLNAKK